MKKIQLFVNIGFVLVSAALVTLFVFYAVLKLQISFTKERIKYFGEIIILYKEGPQNHTEFNEMVNAINNYYPEGSDFIFDKKLRQIVEISRSNNIVILNHIKSQEEMEK